MEKVILLILQIFDRLVQIVKKSFQPDAETADLNLDESLYPAEPNESSSSIKNPLHDTLKKLSQFLDFATLKAARGVNKDWNTAIADEFQKKAILITNFSYKKPSIFEFVSVFSPEKKLIAQSIWIQKPKYLKDDSMIEWLEKYGDQLITVKLGTSITERIEIIETKRILLKKKIFPSWMITSLLTIWCPNLKVLEILVPYLLSPYEITTIDQEEIKVNLDLLTIGSRDNNNGKSIWTSPALTGTSSVLFTVLKCLKSLKTLRIVNVLSSSFNGIEVTSPGDDYGNKVLENIMELDTRCSVNPQHLLGPNTTTKYQQLRKLLISTDEIKEKYFSDFLDSVKDHLTELKFYYMRSSLVHLIPTMPKLEVLKIPLYLDWGNAGLNFLNQLPSLKRLHINSGYNMDVKELFIKNKGKKNRIQHENLKELRFRCSSNREEVFDGIGVCFPNLEKLDIDFTRTDINPVMAELAKYKNIKYLKLHVSSEFKTNELQNWVTESAIETLGLEYRSGFCYSQKLPLNLSWIVHGFLKSGNLRELEVKGMRIFKEEYDLVMKKISTTQLKLRHSFCDILPM